MTHSTASDQGLHFFPMSHKKDAFIYVNQNIYSIGTHKNHLSLRQFFWPPKNSSVNRVEDSIISTMAKDCTFVCVTIKVVQFMTNRK